MLTWRGNKPTQDISLLIAIENDRHIIFPVEYKETAMHYNKGVPSKKCIRCNGRERVFTRLIAINSDLHPNVCDAIKWIDEEPSVIPFGLDPFGNVFAFRYNQPENYEIVFIDLENGDIQTICKSFAEFLNGLYE